MSPSPEQQLLEAGRIARERLNASQTLPTVAELLEALEEHPDILFDLLSVASERVRGQKVKLAGPWTRSKAQRDNIRRLDPLGEPVAVVNIFKDPGKCLCTVPVAPLQGRYAYESVEQAQEVADERLRNQGWTLL